MKNDKSTNRSRKRRKDPQSRLLNFDTSKLLSDATSIVENAASILEEEISAGIVAANNLEDNVVDRQKIRSSDPDDLINRFRGDAHEVVDMLMDLVAQSTVTLRKLNSNISEAKGAKSPASNGMTMLRPDREYKPGETAKIPMMLENDSDEEEMEVSFLYPDMISADNKTISKRNISMNPGVLTIEPASEGKMEIEIYVPKTTDPGAYNMTIRDKHLDELKANIEIVVTDD